MNKKIKMLGAAAAVTAAVATQGGKVLAEEVKENVVTKPKVEEVKPEETKVQEAKPVTAEDVQNYL